MCRPLSCPDGTSPTPNITGYRASFICLSIHSLTQQTLAKLLLSARHGGRPGEYNRIKTRPGPCPKELAPIPWGLQTLTHNRQISVPYFRNIAFLFFSQTAPDKDFYLFLQSMNAFQTIKKESKLIPEPSPRLCWLIQNTASPRAPPTHREKPGTPHILRAPPHPCVLLKFTINVRKM